MWWVSAGCRLMLIAARGASLDAQVAVHPDLHIILPDRRLAIQDMYLAGMCNAAAVYKLRSNSETCHSRCQACDDNGCLLLG